MKVLTCLAVVLLVAAHAAAGQVIFAPTRTPTRTPVPPTPTRTVAHLYLSVPSPITPRDGFYAVVGCRQETGDVNADGKIDALDAMFLINYAFADGPAPLVRRCSAPSRLTIDYAPIEGRIAVNICDPGKCQTYALPAPSGMAVVKGTPAPMPAGFRVYAPPTPLPSSAPRSLPRSIVAAVEGR